MPSQGEAPAAGSTPIADQTAGLLQRLAEALPGYEEWARGQPRRDLIVRDAALAPHHRELLIGLAEERAALEDHFHFLGLQRMFATDGPGPLGLVNDSNEWTATALRSLDVGPKSAGELLGRSFGSTLSRHSYDAMRGAADDPRGRALLERLLILVSAAQREDARGYYYVIPVGVPVMASLAADDLRNFMRGPKFDEASITGGAIMGHLLGAVGRATQGMAPEERHRIAANSYALVAGPMAKSTTDAIAWHRALGGGTGSGAWDASLFEVVRAGTPAARLAIRPDVEAEVQEVARKIAARTLPSKGAAVSAATGRSGKGCPVLHARPHDDGQGAPTKVAVGKLVWLGMLEIARHTGILDPTAAMSWQGDARAIPPAAELWRSVQSKALPATGARATQARARRGAARSNPSPGGLSGR